MRSSPRPTGTGQSGPAGAVLAESPETRWRRYRWKLGANFERKAKSRVVWLGFMEMRVGSPVISRVIIMCVFQTATAMHVRVWGADMKSAYLEGQQDDFAPRKYLHATP